MRRALRVLLGVAVLAVLTALTVSDVLNRAPSGDAGAPLVRMGYDEQGKYILVAPAAPALLEELRVNGRRIAADEWAPVEGLRVPFNWRPGRIHAVDVRLSTGRHVLRVRSPELVPHLSANVMAYNASGEAWQLLQLNYAEYDRILLLRTRHPPERVHILSMPAVSISQDDLDSFTSALAALLRKAQIEVQFGSRVSERELQDDTVLVIAGGVMPSDEKLLDAVRSQRRWGECRIIYLGLQPGAVLVDQNGNTKPGRILPGTISESAEVRSKVLKMKKSLYTSSTFSAAPVRREDGSPAVYLTGCTLVFSNTISGGWDSPEDAAWDVFYAVLTDGSPSPPEAELTPGRDTGSALLRLSYSEQNITLLAFRGDKLSRVLQVGVPAPGGTLNAEVTLLEDPLPGEVEAVVWVSNASGHVRVIATSLSSGRTFVTELGRAEGEASFRAKLQLPPGDVLLSVESGGRLSPAERIHVPVLEARARPVSEGYLVTVTVDGEPYQGEVQVSSPDGKTGRLEIQGKLLVKGTAFTLHIRGSQVPVSYITPERQQFPWWAAALAVLALLLLAAASRIRTEQRRNSIKVRVPAAARQEKHIRVSQVVEAFEKFSRLRGTGYLPLSIEEVAEAVGAYAAGGYLSKESARELMDKLRYLKTGIREALGYYAPATWENETGQSIEHLAMIRAICDWAGRQGIIAKPYLTLDRTFEGAPDVLLYTPRREIVYVEVVSSRKKSSPESIIAKYTRWAENLSSASVAEHKKSIWVVLTDADFERFKKERESWSFSPKLRVLEEDGYLKILPISFFLRQSPED